MRKQIVATTEGGAITGEERLREHTDQLYGSILSYEGKPGDYLIANIETLTRQLGDVTAEFEQVTTNDLPAVNEVLKAQGKEPLVVPPPKVASADDATGAGGRASAALLPANFRLLH